MRREPERVPDSAWRLLDALNTPAIVLGRHLDVLAWNPLAEALLGDPSCEFRRLWSSRRSRAAPTPIALRCWRR